MTVSCPRWGADRWSSPDFLRESRRSCLSGCFSHSTIFLFKWLGRLQAQLDAQYGWTPRQDSQDHPSLGQIIAETLRLRITLFYLLDKTTTYLLVRSFRTSQWRIIAKEGPKYTALESSRIHVPQMELPIPMVFWKTRQGLKSSITGGCTVDRRDPIVFVPLPVNTSGRLYDDFLLLLFLYSWANAYVRIVTWH